MLCMKNCAKKTLALLLTIMMLFSTLSTVSNAAHENTYTNTGNQRNDIIGVAKTQLGYREGNNNDTKYGTWYGLPNQPWCAMFISWCARQAGIPTSVLKNSAVAAPDAQYFNIPYYNGASYTPQPGDLFFTKSFSHVGLVYYIDGSYFYTIEGNSNTNGSSEGTSVVSNRRKISNFYFGVPNYSGGTSHSIDSNYGKNFTSYPKEKITAGNIFDENHNQISSTAWIGTSDECTIHEVYTDGCCKVSYPLDSGGTKTVYSKISLFNTHTHAYLEEFEAAHPHHKYMRCSCGDYYYTNSDAATYQTAYEEAHPHREYSKCNMCGDITYSGNKAYVNDCTECKGMASNWSFENYTMPGSHNVYLNSDFNFFGTVKSELPINWVGIVIYDGDDNELASLNMYPGTNFCDISVMNDQFDFSALPSGKYKILVHANNPNNDYAILYKDVFNVGAPLLNAPTPKVATTSAGNVIVTWNSVENANNYDVRFFTLSGESVKNEWGVCGTSYETHLPDGDYKLWMCSSNSNFYNCYTYGEEIYFTIKRTLPGKPEFNSLGTVFNENSPISLDWLESEKTTNYNIFLEKYNEQTAAYEDFSPSMSDVTSGCTVILSAGRYRIQLQSVNSESNEFTNGDWNDFSVIHCYDSGTVTLPSDCINHGCKTFECTQCGAKKTEQLPTDSSRHTGETQIKNALKQSCTTPGYTGDIYCLSCGELLSKGNLISATGHKDNDSDGKCDDCNEQLNTTDIPEEPDNQDNSCNHICHKKGIARIVYVLIRIIWKILGKNRYCSCGAAHY